METLVSICIPTYNGARWLRECIASAQKCTLPCEIIVVDDVSSDETVAIAQELSGSDDRIKVFVNPVNLGLAANWNRCLELANGKWIKFLFQDDRLGANCLEKMIGAAGETDVFIAAHRNYVFAENSSADARKYYTETVTTLDTIAPGTKAFSPDLIAAMAAQYPSVNFLGEPSTVIFQRALVNEVGTFDTALQQLCDLEYWLRITTRYGMIYEPEAQVDFAIHQDSMSTQNAGGRKFVSTYLDPVRVADALVNGTNYSLFRSRLNSSAFKRLSLWLNLRCFEAAEAATTDEKRAELNKLYTDRPHLREVSGKLKYRILFKLLQLRRKIR